MIYVYGLLLGCVMGLLSGLFGVGGGIIAVPGMIYLFDMNPKIAMGTSLVAIVPIAFVGSIKQFQQSQVDLRIALLLAVLGMAFGYLGAWLNHQMDTTLLRRLFAIFIVVTGIKMLVEPPKAQPHPVAPVGQVGQAGQIHKQP